MIPLKYLREMSIYGIVIQGATVKVRVVDHAPMVDVGLSELRAQMRSTTVVGLFLKSSSMGTRLLQLCAGNRCLVLVLHVLESIPQCLRDFLADQGILFVGVGISQGLSRLKSSYGLECKSGVELGDLAARVLKKPNLVSVPITALAAEVGLTLDQQPASVVSINQSARYFSHEEIDCLIRDVHFWKLIGTKLLGTVNTTW